MTHLLKEFEFKTTGNKKIKQLYPGESDPLFTVVTSLEEKTVPETVNFTP